MNKHIDPKPTLYRNILFRSRLEARMAVTFDNCPNVLNWLFEPHKFTLKGRNWDYTPDFLVELFLKGNKSRFYIEVKPAEPTTEYLKLISTIASKMKYPLLLIIPDYYNNRIKSWTLWPKSYPIRIKDFFVNFGPAFKHAAQFRFDLRSV